METNRAEEILIKTWDAQNMDLQLCITSNPQIALIKEAMQEYADYVLGEYIKEHELPTQICRHHRTKDCNDIFCNNICDGYATECPKYDILPF